MHFRGALGNCLFIASDQIHSPSLRNRYNP